MVATPGALAALKKAGQQPGEFLTRHVHREWGDLSDEDRRKNDYRLERGFRLLSACKTNAGDPELITYFLQAAQQAAVMQQTKGHANLTPVVFKKDQRRRNLEIGKGKVGFAFEIES